MLRWCRARADSSTTEVELAQRSPKSQRRPLRVARCLAGRDDDHVGSRQHATYGEEGAAATVLATAKASDRGET